jgi:hypothetical protein
MNKKLLATSKVQEPNKYQFSIVLPVYVKGKLTSKGWAKGSRVGIFLAGKTLLVELI